MAGDLTISGGGAAIRRLREKVGVGLNELAGKLAWNPGRLSRYETNKIGVSLHAICELGDKLGVPPEQLLLECLKELNPGLSQTAGGKILEKIVAQLAVKRPGVR